MNGHQGKSTDRRQPRRWRVLAAVTGVDSPATVDEITDELHDRRAPSDPLAGLESWDRTHQRLHEVDLPALDVAGLLEFDEDRGVVTIPPEAPARGMSLEAETDDAAADDRPGESQPADTTGWHGLYLGTAIISAGLILVSTSTLVPRRDIAMTVAAAVVVGLFAVLGAAQMLSAR